MFIRKKPTIDFANTQAHFVHMGVYHKYESKNYTWPRGPTDKASDFESEDCGFESHRGRFIIDVYTIYYFHRSLGKGDVPSSYFRRRGQCHGISSGHI